MPKSRIGRGVRGRRVSGRRLYLEVVASEERRIECVDLARAPGQGGHVGGHSGTCADLHGLVAAPLPVLVYEPVSVLVLLEGGVLVVMVVGMEDEAQ